MLFVTSFNLVRVKFLDNPCVFDIASPYAFSCFAFKAAFHDFLYF